MYKRQKKQPFKGSWMVTYSDMVTLLLCFFVLMYAVSSVDSAKWEMLVRNLNPSTTAMPVPGGGDSFMTADEAFNQLYERMKTYVEENSMTNDVEVRGGAGYTFITFRNNVLFDGDRYNLRPDGMRALDFLCEGIAMMKNSIKEMRIMGHTNQADPNNPNAVRGDRFLASNRAAEVLVYIQEKNIIEAKKLASIGYGQFYPVASFEREEDRLRNRRVEILITEEGTTDVSLEQIYEQINPGNINY